MAKQARGIKILVMHGPNLNLLGTREPTIYGTETLAEVNRRIERRAEELGVFVETFQSNSEADLMEKIHSSRKVIDGIVFNPAAFTHTSVAIRDALLATEIPFVEIHLSNIAAREPFRHKSFFTDIAMGTVSGLGSEGYVHALEGLVAGLKKRKENDCES